MTAAARIHHNLMMRNEFKALAQGQLENLVRNDPHCCGLDVGDWPMCVRCRMASAASVVLRCRRYDDGAKRLREAREAREEQRALDREYDRRMEHEHHILGMSASEAARREAAGEF
jgi:hypothetical protein